MLATALREAKDKLVIAIDEYNAATTDPRAAVESALKEYNEALAEAKGFAEDIANEAESEFDNKSEKWQEGDRGQAVSERSAMVEAFSAASSLRRAHIWGSLPTITRARWDSLCDSVCEATGGNGVLCRTAPQVRRIVGFVGA